MPSIHLHDELAQTHERLVVKTRFGPVTGGRSGNGAAVFLEIPYALPPGRFEDPVPLPSDFRYQDRDYITESSYAVQPTNDGQTAGTKFEDKVGLGRPTENPLFLNIVAPPSFPMKSGFAVKIYIHGGFLQFGSPHHLESQAQHIAAERSEVWVNIGYRLSVFGFLACDRPRIEGNFGFKDQWVALEWVHDNIGAFGGDPENIQITGVSAGRRAQRSSAVTPRFEAATWSQGAIHISYVAVKRYSVGAVLPSDMFWGSGCVGSRMNPKTPAELRPQFLALCRALGLDPDGIDTLSVLRDPERTSWRSITEIIDNEQLGPYGTFRGCLDGTWLSDVPDPMAWQRNGDLARGLLEHGVRNAIIGDLSEEWFLYSIAHPIKHKVDIHDNLERYYPLMAQHMIDLYGRPPVDAKVEELEKLFGVILSAGQVHLPVRLLHRDLLQAGFPTFRYTIKWTPEQGQPGGYVTHGTDRVLWALRTPELTDPQVDVARGWLDAIDQATQELDLSHSGRRNLKEVLTLQADKQIEWTVDEDWDEATKLRKLLPGEL